MTDKELKNNMKKLLLLIIIVLVIIVGLAKYIFISEKAELSVYASNDEMTTLQALGINEEEMNKYLSVFGNLVDEKYSENQRILNMATNYIEDMYSSYEIQTDEQDRKIFDASIIHSVAQEIQGTYIKDYIHDEKIYSYDAEQNRYIQNEVLNRIPYCIKINDVSKNENEIRVEYTLAIMTPEQMAEYSIGNEIDLEKYEVKAILMENSEAEYSKYFVSSIEKK